MRQFLHLILLASLICGCGNNICGYCDVECRPDDTVYSSDTLNAYGLYRTYPEPCYTPDPAPKGYKAVYLSSYNRHGSRKLHIDSYTKDILEVLNANPLTEMGEVLSDKIKAIDADQQNTVGNLSHKGTLQHRAIAARMYERYPEIFGANGLEIRTVSTAYQRTMMSMFAQTESLLRLNPTIQVSRDAFSNSYLNNSYPNTINININKIGAIFLDGKLDTDAILSRIFKEQNLSKEQLFNFLMNLYISGSIVCDLDIEGVHFLRTIMTEKEIEAMHAAANYYFYTKCSNSPEMGKTTLHSQIPLLKDFITRAELALESGKPSADLRFGHDSILMPLIALMGLNGYDRVESDPAKVINVFQDYLVTPMGGNVQMVLYRNRKGNVLVKFLHNENEAILPIDTDCFPYYHWDDVCKYFAKRIEEFS